MPRIIHDGVNLDDALSGSLVLNKKTLILFHGPLGSPTEAAYEKAKVCVDDANQMALLIVHPEDPSIPEAAGWFGATAARYITLAAGDRKELDRGDVPELNGAYGTPTCLKILGALGGQHPS